MKKYLIIAALCAGFIMSLPAQSTGSTLYVGVKNAILKSSTGFFADARGTLNLGDTVTVIQSKNDWVEVRSTAQPSLTGWIQSASLTSKQIVTSGSRSASASELALAGKGFSGDVEKVYQDEEGVDFSAVNSMESQNIPNRELYNFVVEGHLSKGE
jgi:uncharacterized protein YgiM (DUF1202 family)